MRQVMRNDMHNKIGFTNHPVSSQAFRRSRRAVFAITLMMWLAARSMAFDARDQKQAQSQGAPPDLQITQVKPLAALNVNATTDVEVRWTAQVPRLTTLEGFDISLEARYSDGSKSAARSEQLKPS